MILMIDNYDSFTFNLVQYFGMLGQPPHVLRNDAVSVEEIERLSPEAIVISPGPGRPEDAGIIVDAVRRFAGKIPILGVCLGHQAIGLAFGASVVAAPRIMHGKTSDVRHDGRTIFEGLQNPFVATRYHSLAVSEGSLPPSLEVSARSDDGVIMGLRHRELAVEGVQFHPESFLTIAGMALIANFLRMTGKAVQRGEKGKGV